MKKYEYRYSPEKDKKLKAERGISFKEVIDWIEAGKVVAIAKHPNPAKYPGQRVYIIEHDGYAYNVPFVREGNTIF